MIGPSAPNGPPDPIEMADDSGFSSAALRLDPAAVHQNGFNRFGDAVAADALGPVPRHDADDQRAADGHEDDQQPEMMTGGRHERRVESLKEEKVRAESDQFQQRGGDVGGDDADPRSEEGDRDDAWRGREIAQVIELGRGRRWHGSVYQPRSHLFVASSP
jgi:hypothetical protein